jgi:XRE family aerobic/anaerobic benzoate catabolism transcriptional regulator
MTRTVDEPRTRQAKLQKEGESVVLGELGARIRAWRARRGMTRKALAEQSGMSLRFLNEVEAGRGNLSVNSLEFIARAMNIELLDLMQESPRPALARVVDMLEGLDEADLDRAHTLLAKTFRHTEMPGREKRIALVGLRGAGKSTLGERLAASRNVPFVELDREIEREAGTSINEVLLLHGQAGYRRLELRALLRVCEEHKDGVVMTTGGSIVSERETFDTLQRYFYCIWIKASAEEHMWRVVAQGDIRPFQDGTLKDLGDPKSQAASLALEDIRRILASRENLYARSDAVVDTSARTIKQSLADLQRAAPRKRHGS